MNYCPHCKSSISGSWKTCPLCNHELVISDSPSKSSWQNVPLQFNRIKAIRSFISLSLILVILYFVLDFFFHFKYFGLQYVIFGLLITWTTLVIIIRKRSNLAKMIIYMLIFFSIISIYFDYTLSWSGWSITFVIPILCISAQLGMTISTRFIKLKVKDYILYLQLAALLGFIPLVFLIMNWVVYYLPSILSVVLSFILFIITLFKYKNITLDELKKRFHF